MLFRSDVTDISDNAATQVTRTVNVVAGNSPVITLTGTNPQTITVNDPYTELGATAYDTEDHDLTSQIVINDSAVDTAQVGSYTVSYSVTDLSGHTTIAQRTVNIVSLPAPQVITTTTGAGNAQVSLDEGILVSSPYTGSLPSNPPSGTFPYGYFAFNATLTSGQTTATITITLPSNVPTNAQYYKIIGGAYVDATALAGSSITDGDNVITLTINDNGFGDDNPVVGSISDPGVIVIPSGGSGGGGSRGSMPSISGLSYTGPTVSGGAIGFGGILNLDPNKPITNVIPVGQNSDILLKISNTDGSGDLQYMAIYFLKPGTSPIDWKDTWINWDKYNGVTVTDPSHILGDVSVKTTDVGQDLQYSIRMNFKTEMEKSDILIKAWTLKRNSVEQRYSNAIQVVKVGSENTPNPQLSKPLAKHEIKSSTSTNTNTNTKDTKKTPLSKLTIKKTSSDLSKTVLNTLGQLFGIH